MGKAHLNRQEYDKAIAELETAAQAEPKLPFVHFNLGIAHLRQQDYERDLNDPKWLERHRMAIADRDGPT